MQLSSPPIRVHGHPEACSRLENYLDQFSAAIVNNDVHNARRWIDLARRQASMFGLTATLRNTLDGWRWRAVTIR